jgi:hypothetical protein
MTGTDEDGNSPTTKVMVRRWFAPIVISNNQVLDRVLIIMCSE